MILENTLPKQMLLPPVHFQKLQLDEGKHIHIAREDLLTGGTKQRACLPYLKHLMGLGRSKFIYASPFAGFAQVALAYCSQALGAEAVLFCEKDPSTQESHEFSLLAQKYGARIILCESLLDAESKAITFLKQNPQFFKIPLGFDDPQFRTELKNALIEPLSNFFQANPKSRSLWVSLGSGTLLKCLRQVLPQRINIEAVDVHVLSAKDPRIQVTKELEGVRVHSAKQEFHVRCEEKPPLPSNIHYDAKVWGFLNSSADENDLWWNVAR